jgi:hypothetical protein
MTIRQGDDCDGALGLRHLAMHVATEDERDRLASRMTFPVHLQTGQVLRIKTQLGAPTD